MCYFFEREGGRKDNHDGIKKDDHREVEQAGPLHWTGKWSRPAPLVRCDELTGQREVVIGGSFHVCVQ